MHTHARTPTRHHDRLTRDRAARSRTHLYPVGRKSTVATSLICGASPGSLLLWRSCPESELTVGAAGSSEELPMM